MSIKAPKHKRINPFPPWSLSLRHKSLSVQNGSREVCMGLKIFWGFLIKVLKRRFQSYSLQLNPTGKVSKYWQAPVKSKQGVGVKEFGTFSGCVLLNELSYPSKPRLSPRSRGKASNLLWIWKNVQCINDAGKWFIISNLLKSWKLDILCLQETKMETDFSWFGPEYVGWFVLPSIGASGGGILLMWINVSWIALKRW